MRRRFATAGSAPAISATWTRRGFVYITGRASDMYISGGSNIYPREIEEKILTHPAVGEVAVLGVPDPFWGEVGVAVCVARARAPSAVSEAELAAYLAPKVPRYKMPKRFFFWEALPKSGYGKVPKRLIRDELEARGLLDDHRRTQTREVMRSIAQPGLACARAHSMGGGARARLLLHAAGRHSAAGGRAPRLCGGRILRRRVEHAGGGALGPFAYVMPALSKTGANAAFYSETFRPDGVTRLKLATMTFGERDGAPFFHCHGLWTEADGRFNGGHMLPEETVVAEPFEVQAFGIDGAMFRGGARRRDQFQAVRAGCRASAAGAETTSRAFALRLRPNQDFACALEGFCRAARHPARARCTAASARTIGACFTDGRTVVPFATELAVTRGRDRARRRRRAARPSSISRWSIISAASPRAGWCAATIRC